MHDADETNRPGCFENLAYHLSQTRWFLDRLDMKTLHDEVKAIQEQVQRERQRESEKGNDNAV